MALHDEPSHLQDEPSEDHNRLLARKSLVEKYHAWNSTHHAPFGRDRLLGLPALDAKLFAMAPSLRGPFGFQDNNTTRVVEYPWAFHATPITPGLRVLEIGGGLSGFQFALDRAGCEVVNVDPGNQSHGRGWPVDAKSLGQLNRAFRTQVTLHN